MSGREARGGLRIFKEDESFVVCRKRRMEDPLGRRPNEYEIIGRGVTISETLRSAADKIPADVEGVRWSDEW